MICGILTVGKDSEESDLSLGELELLVRTAGAVVIDRRLFKRERIDASHVIGKGHLDELERVVRSRDIRLVVFDLNDIRPAQVRNLEDRLKCRVVGRTEIIMDIFARRARSAEASIQVELAQLRYILPRLKGLGGVLSRLGGGIGTRGPGEKMLETDRRHILRRISTLKKKLDKVRKHRETARKSRRRELVGAVVGYTNAGKSTRINTRARDDLFVEDRLFATLDSYTRSVYLGEGRKCLLVDTVGFIRNLPAHLVESFKSTLEEIVIADFIIHVIDISSRDMASAISTVNREITRLECGERETILFFNKADLLPARSAAESVANNHPGAIIGSASRGVGIEALKARIGDIHDRHFRQINY